MNAVENLGFPPLGEDVSRLLINLMTSHSPHLHFERGPADDGSEPIVGIAPIGRACY
jgi:hypothetical protein